MVARREFAKYGRNTICAEVNCGNRLLVFDAGSGIAGLGRKLAETDTREMDLFLTHAHYDHVEGIPFFQPFYEADFRCRIWSGRLKGINHTRDIVDGLMKEPYFPIRQEKFRARIDYANIADDQLIDLGDGITVKTGRLHHPGGATGYRVEYAGRAFAFVTDTTHAPDQRDNATMALIDGADLFAYDCSYTDEEFPQFASFGHSTWEEALRLREASGAKRMLGLHHMPFRDDKSLDRIEKTLLAQDEGKSGIAHDGMIVSLSG